MAQRAPATIKRIERRQRELAPKDDLAPYSGQWVALRKGRVVASNLDPVRLREDPDVQPEDVILPVADAEGNYFL